MRLSVARLAMVGLVVSFAVGPVAGCREVELTSAWVTGAVEVDGVDDEWTGAVTYFEKQDVSVGCSTTRSFCMSAS